MSDHDAAMTAARPTYRPARSEVPDTAIAEWLVTGSKEPEGAFRTWRTGRYAMVPTGTAFDAVRMPQELVHAAVGSWDPEVVAGALSEILDGPVIRDPDAWIYALVPPRTTETWRSPHAVVRGRGAWLAMPRTDLIHPTQSRIYWAVPVDTVGQLCSPADVADLLRVGEHRLAYQALLEHATNCPACTAHRPCRAGDHLRGAERESRQ
ncbi:hypothetical protein [Streptomyces sp. NPDC057617]|uniref:hypothetical protein n=1 Tax=Streptomyces sp. NPDC057617 TaxID=3346184 RepID=UPI0036C6AF84